MSGGKQTVKLSYREAVREAIREAMCKDQRVFLIGEDVGRYGGCFAVSKGLLQDFGPERIRDTPLSESAFVGAGIGAAMGGMRPIVEIMTVNFSLLAADQILNNAATILHMSGGQFNIPLVIRFTSNIPEIVPYLAYVLLGIPLPLTIIQILAIDLGTDMLPALALGAEPPTGDAMRTPPRPRGEPLLTTAMLRRAYAFLGPIEAAAGMASYFYILIQGGWSWGQMPPILLYHQATTACLTAVIVTQVANGFVCRSPRQSVFSLGMWSNRLLLLGVLVEVGLQLAIVYSPVGQKIFATAAPLLRAWLFALPFALLLFAADEGRKALRWQG